MGVVRRVVPSLDQRPFEEDPAAEGGAEVAAGVHQLVQRPPAGCGDEKGALLLVRRVERDRQVDGARLVRHAAYARDDAHGAEGDPPGAEREAAGVAQDIHGPHHGVVVVQRLPHSHEHDVAEALGLPGREENARRADHLRDDLAGGQLAAEPHLAGGAEDAAHRAARLAADARGRPAREAHEHGLDPRAVGELQEELAREAVARGRLQADGKVSNAGLGLEARAHAGRNLPQVAQRGGESEIKVPPKARRVVGAEPPRFHEGVQLGSGQPVEVGQSAVHEWRD